MVLFIENSIAVSFPGGNPIHAVGCNCCCWSLMPGFLYGPSCNREHSLLCSSCKSVSSSVGISVLGHLCITKPLGYSPYVPLHYFLDDTDDNDVKLII